MAVTLIIGRALAGFIRRWMTRSSQKGGLTADATAAFMKTKTRSPELGQDLSKRELEVLALLVEGLSNREIGQRLKISPSTVKHHVSACMSKLEAANRAQAAALAVELQLIPRSQA